MVADGRGLLDSAIPEEEWRYVREHVRTGCPLRNSDFVARLEREVGRVLRPQKAGRRRNCTNTHNRFVSPESPAMRRIPTKLSTLQRLLLRFSLDGHNDGCEASSDVDAYYFEVFAAIGWDKTQIDKYPELLQQNICQLHADCSILESLGIVVRVIGGNHEPLGVRLTASGLDAVTQDRRINRVAPQLPPSKRQLRITALKKLLGIDW